MRLFLLGVVVVLLLGAIACENSHQDLYVSVDSLVERLVKNPEYRKLLEKLIQKALENYKAKVSPEEYRLLLEKAQRRKIFRPF